MALEQYSTMIHKKKHFLLFSLLVLFFLGLYSFFLLTRHHDIHWDEAVYMSMGKYLYSFGTEGLFESIRPLGLPLVLGFFWMIGLGELFVYQTIIFLFALGTLLLVYLLGKELFSSEAGLFAALALVLTPIFFQSSVSIMTEIPAVFFVVLSFFLFIKQKHPFFVGLAAATAFLFKFPAGLILPILLFLFLIRQEHIRKKITNCCFFTAGSVTALFPFFAFNYFHYRHDTATFFDAIFRPLILGGDHAANPVHAISGLWQDIFYYILELVKNNPLLLFGFFGSIFFFFSKEKKKNHYQLFVLLFIFFVYFSSIVNKQLRFAVLFLPFLALFTGDILQQILTFIPSNLKKIMFYLILFYPLLTFSFFPTLTLVYRFYPQEPLAIESEYYSYFIEYSNATLLTTEPYFTAYSNGILAHPYYNNLTDATEIYDQYKDDADYVIFTSDFYPCSDPSCIEQMALLHKEIASTHTLIYSQEWNGVEREIFVK